MEPEPSEEIFFCGHASWRSMLGLCLRGLALSLLAGVAAGIASATADGRVHAWWVTVAVVVVFAVALAVIQLVRVRTTYAITSRRLTIERGLLARELHQTRLERIQNVNARQSMAQRALGIGTVDFDTAGESGFDFAFRGIADPRGLVQTVDRALHELHSGRAEVGEPL
ncbi:MAG: PH domain-containing protein [Solirubrobacteraceae bacterium]